MNTIPICKAAGEEIIDLFGSTISDVMTLTEICDEASVNAIDHAYIVTIPLKNARHEISLVVPMQRLDIMKHWLSGGVEDGTTFLEALWGKR